MTKKLGIPMFTDPTAGTQAANHPEGNAFYKNLVDIVTPEYDGISANGTGLVLGATNDLPIPVGYDLGSELADINTFINHNATHIVNVDTIGITTTGNQGGVYQYYTTIIGETYYFTFNAIAGSNACTIQVGTSDFSGAYFQEVNVTGLFTFEWVATDTTVAVSLRSGEDGIGNTCSFNNISVKQVTAAGYLTYETDDGVVQIGNAVDGGGSGTELVINGDFSDGITDWYGRVGITTITDVGGAMRIERSISGGYSRAEQDMGITLSANKKYEYSIEIVDMPIDVGVIFIDIDGNNYQQIGNFGSGLGVLSGEFLIGVDGGTFIVGSSSQDIGEYFTVDNISIKEILPNSTTYTLVDDTYRWAYVNENPFSEADLTAIAEEPNKIVEFAMDGTGLTNTQGVDDKFYAMTEYSS